MPFDLKKIREENPGVYGSKSLREIANSLYINNPIARSMYGSVDEWQDREGLRAEWEADDASISRAKMIAEQNREIENRGFFGSAASSVTRGIVGGAEMALRGARGIKRLASDDPIEKGIFTQGLEAIDEYKEITPFLRAKQSKGVVGRSLREGVESATTSLTTAMAGAALGSAIAPGPGTIVGGVIGWIAGAPLFGLAEYDSVIEEGMNSEGFKDGKFTREELESAAIKSGVAEAGFEFASNLLDILFLKGGGRFLTAGARKAAKESWKQLITGGIKGTSKRIGMVMAAEVPSELATAAVQTDPHNLITGEEKHFFESMKEALGPTLVASTIFGALGDAGFRSNISMHKKILENVKVDEETRLKSVEAVGRELDRVAPQYSKAWRDNATETVKKNLPVSEKLVDDDSLGESKDDLEVALDKNPMNPDLMEDFLQKEIEEVDQLPVSGEAQPVTKPPKPPKEQIVPVELEKDPSKLKPEDLKSEIDRMDKERKFYASALTEKTGREIEKYAETEGMSVDDARGKMAIDFAQTQLRHEEFKRFAEKQRLTEEITKSEAAKKLKEGGQEVAVDEPKTTATEPGEQKTNEIDALEGKYVDYQGIEGFLRKDKDGYHVVAPDQDVLVEGGEAGRPIGEIGLTRMKRPTIKYDEKTKAPQKSSITDKVGAYDPQTKTLTRPDGESWLLTDFNRNDKGKLVSAIFTDQNGKEKTIRSASIIRSFAETQSIYNEATREKAPMKGTKSALEGLRDETKLPEVTTEGRGRAKEDRELDKEIQRKYQKATPEDITFDLFAAVASDKWVNEATPREIAELNDIVGLEPGTDVKELKRFATRWLETYIPIMAGETAVQKREPVTLDEKLPPSVDIVVSERFADREGTYTRTVKADVAAKDTNDRIRSYEKIMSCLRIY